MQSDYWVHGDYGTSAKQPTWIQIQSIYNDCTNRSTTKLHKKLRRGPEDWFIMTSSILDPRYPCSLPCLGTIFLTELELLSSISNHNAPYKKSKYRGPFRAIYCKLRNCKVHKRNNKGKSNASLYESLFLGFFKEDVIYLFQIIPTFLSFSYLFTCPVHLHPYTKISVQND